MVLVDTSVWIEFLKGKQPWQAEMRRLLEDREVLAVEPVFGELLQGAKGDREREIILDYWQNLPKPNIQDVWIKAGEQSAKNKWLTRGVGLIDAVLIISARHSKASLWTKDNKLKSLLSNDETHVFVR